MRHRSLIRLRVQLRRTRRKLGKAFEVVRPYQAQFNSCLILGSIFAIGTWGHLNHWQFGGHGHEDHLADAHSDGGGHTDSKAPHHRTDGHDEKGSDQLSQVSNKASQETESRPHSTPEVVKAHAIFAHNPNYVANLSSRVSGVVHRVLKRVGDHVEKGDVLVLIEAPGVGEAKSELLKALVQQDLKSSTLKHLEDLGSVVSEKKIQEAEAEASEAGIQLFNAQQTLIALGLPVDLKEFSGKQDSEMAEQVLTLGIPESVRSEYGTGSLSANLIPIVAPFEGEILNSRIVVGQYIQGSQPEITIADRKHYRISLNIRREDAGKIYVGQDLTFQADSSDEILKGQVDWISTEVDETTRTLQAWAELTADSPEEVHHLRSNSLGTCHLSTVRPAKIASEPGLGSPR